MTMPMTAPAPQRTHGVGRVGLTAIGERTTLNTLYQEGAFKARALQPPGQQHMDMALINTAGGLTGGDHMALEVAAGANTCSTFSTQACEKFYKSSGALTRVDTRLSLEEGAGLNWLPQEAIVFNEARVARTITVSMAASSRLLLAESIIFGRTARQERFTSGQFRDRWDIQVDGQPVHTERFEIRADGDGHLTRATMLAGNTAMFTLLLVAKDAQSFVDPVRRRLSAGNCRGGASAWRMGNLDKLVVRLLARDGYDLRQAMLPVLSVLGEGRTLPRLWHA